MTEDTDVGATFGRYHGDNDPITAEPIIRKFAIERLCNKATRREIFVSKIVAKLFLKYVD